jgi:hypothetical protein
MTRSREKLNEGAGDSGRESRSRPAAPRTHGASGGYRRFIVAAPNDQEVSRGVNTSTRRFGVASGTSGRIGTKGCAVAQARVCDQGFLGSRRCS